MRKRRKEEEEEEKKNENTTLCRVKEMGGVRAVHEPRGRIRSSSSSSSGRFVPSRALRYLESLPSEREQQSLHIVRP